MIHRLFHRPTPQMLLAAAVLVAPAWPAAAQDFAAELTRRGADGQIATGHVQVSGGKVRIETPELPDGFFIVRSDAAYYVRPGRHEYMEARESSPLTEMLVPLDPEAPCRQWQAMAAISRSADNGGAWRCQRVGIDTYDGHLALRYAMTSPRQKRYTGWIDPRLRFVVRLEGDDGTVFDLGAVHEGAQPDTAFEIPAAYRRFDPLALIERIKHSDVWVAPSE